MAEPPLCRYRDRQEVDVLGKADDSSAGGRGTWDVSAEDLDAGERWVDDWQSGIQRRTAEAAELSRRVAGLSGTARSDDGTVEATVDGSGRLTGLQLDDRIHRYSARVITEKILDTVHEAYADLAEQVREAAAETVGADSELGRVVLASYANHPAPEDDNIP
jgi:DNA-binding protein YbaB